MFIITKMIKPANVYNLMTVRHLSSIEKLESFNAKYDIIQCRNRLNILNHKQFKKLELKINNRENSVFNKHDSQGYLKKCFWTQNSNKSIGGIGVRETDMLKQLFTYNLQSTKNSNLTINFLGNEGGTVGTILSSLITYPDSKIIWISDSSGIDSNFNFEYSPIPIVSGKTKVGESNFLEWLKDKPKLDLSNLIYIGLSNPTPFDKALIKKHNITHMKPDNIDYTELANKIYACNVHISFDTNIIYPMEHDFINMTSKTGLMEDQIYRLICIINRFSHIFKLDIIEVDPYSTRARFLNEYKTIVLGSMKLSRRQLDNVNKKYDNLCSSVIINNVLAPTLGYGF